jgi:hypothetical protein
MVCYSISMMNRMGLIVRRLSAEFVARQALMPLTGGQSCTGRTHDRIDMLYYCMYFDGIAEGSAGDDPSPS